MYPRSYILPLYASIALSFFLAAFPEFLFLRKTSWYAYVWPDYLTLVISMATYMADYNLYDKGHNHTYLQYTIASIVRSKQTIDTLQPT